MMSDVLDLDLHHVDLGTHFDVHEDAGQLYLKETFAVIYPDLVKGHLIGAGAFGKVYLLTTKTPPLKFVVKEMIVNANESDTLLKAFKREAEVLKNLPEHHRIVPFYGYAITDSIRSIFLGFMEMGSIRLLLNCGPLPVDKSLIYTRQILEGLEFLHRQGVIHRDIKGANILLEDEENIRITDFGLAKVLDEKNNTMEIGTCRWMAPEVINSELCNGNYSFKADIWSVGCTLLEMITGQRPYEHMTNIGAVVYSVASGKLPMFPSCITERVKQFFDKTFVFDHMKRMSAEELLCSFFQEDQDEFKPEFKIQVFVRFLDGEVYCIALQPTCTIKYMKYLIQSKTAFPIDKQRLIFKGTELKNGLTLLDYNIQEASTISLVSYLYGGGDYVICAELKAAGLPPNWSKGETFGTTGNAYFMIDPQAPNVKRIILKEIPRSSLKKNVESLKILRKYQHERIIPFYGMLKRCDNYQAIFAFMPFGTLKDVYTVKGPVTEEKCVMYAEQILEGLEYLHRHDICHNNLHGQTIYLETEEKIRISGFKICHKGDQKIESAVYGKERWTAPEFFNPAYGEGMCGIKSDIWSLGCTMVELLTADVPYPDLRLTQSVVLKVSQGTPPSAGHSVSEKMKSILEKFFCPTAELRLGASDMLKLCR